MQDPGLVRRAVVAPANYQVLTRYDPKNHRLNYIAISILESVAIDNTAHGRANLHINDGNHLVKYTGTYSRREDQY